MKAPEIIDARNGDHIVTTGDKLQGLIRNTIGLHRDAYKALMNRMNNELASKEDAIPLMIALSITDGSVKEQTLFFKACIERAVWLDREIRDLNALGPTFNPASQYRISFADAKRFGL